MIIVPRCEQMQDRVLAEWIGSIPEHVATYATFVKATMVVSYVMLAVGICFSIFKPAIDSVKDTYKAKAAMSWPTTDGQVTESWPWVHTGRGCTRGVRLSYTYTVEHLHYTGHRYQFGDVCTADVRGIAAANPVGKHIAVHYRPGNPADSVLAPGGITFNMIYRVCGGIGMTAFFLFMFHRRTRNDTATGA